MPRQKISILIAIAVCVGLSNTALAASTPDEQYTYTIKNVPLNPDGTYQKDWISVWFADKPNFPNIPMLVAYKDGATLQACDSINDGVCGTALDFSYVSNLAFCSTSITNNCIVSVSAILKDGKKISASSIEYLPKNPIVKNESSPYHPGGAQREIFVLPGVNHGGGSDNYAIEVYFQGSFNLKDRTGNSGYSFSDPVFGIRLDPVTVKRMTLAIPTFEKSSPGGISYRGDSMFRQCAAFDVDTCALPEKFPKDVKFEVSLKLSSPLYGWFHGRLFEPEFSSEGNIFTFSGFPSQVPSIAGGANYSKGMTPTLLETYKTLASKGGPIIDNYTADRGTDGVQALVNWLPILGDKATVMPSAWSVRNIRKNEFQNIGVESARCIVSNSGFGKGIGGMVNTNSTTYMTGPPSFNSSDQTLNYKVASPHLSSDGSEFKGYYNLRISRDLAKCLYGINLDKAKASISVVNSNGIASVATTSSSISKDWVTFTAANFSFSDPTIKVKLFEETPAKPESIQPQSSTSSAKTVTRKIICIKGKTKRTLTGVNPRCPAGFKIAN